MRKYDLVIIGGGSAGLSAAEIGMELDLDIALVEKDRIGGDCTWTGCIPSKTLLKIASVAHEMREADRYGLPANALSTNLSTVMKKVKDVVAEIYENESPRVLKGKGIDVYSGGAQFIDPRTVIVDQDLELQGRYFLIATGARQIIPDLPGLQKVNYLTYESIWSLGRLPHKLLVLGGGPTGVELGQAFSRLGSKVQIIESQAQILPGVDPEAAQLLRERMEAEDIDIHSGARVDRVSGHEGSVQIYAGDQIFEGDVLLLAVGREPRMEGLGLDQAGVQYEREGIVTDRYMKTNQSHIYAAGDVTGGPQYTHLAGWQAFRAVRNAFLPLAERGKINQPVRITFTTPEIAQVGYTAGEARIRFGNGIRVNKWEYKGLDRAFTDFSKEGFVKVISQGGGTVIGATIAGKGAGELIHEWALAIDHDLRVEDIAFSLHGYPTFSLANMQAAAQILSRKMMGGFSGKVIRAWSNRSFN